MSPDIPVVVGTGFAGDIASNQHNGALRALQESGLLSFVAACDPRIDALVAAIPELANASFPDQQAMLAGRPEATAVTIAAPNMYQPTLANEALRDHNLHVLVEKPGAQTVSAFDQLVESARDAGRTLVVAYHNRYAPEVIELFKMIDSGQIGRIESFEYEARGCFPADAKRDWFMKVGPFEDMGTNALSVILPVLQQANGTDLSSAGFEITGTDFERLADSETEAGVADKCAVDLKIDGVYGHMVTNWQRRDGFVSTLGFTDDRGQRIEVDCAQHTIVIGGEIVFDAGQTFGEDGVYRDDESYLEVYRHFLECIRTSETNVDLARLNIDIVQTAINTGHQNVKTVEPTPAIQLRRLQEMDADLVLDIKCQLGEGPVWLPDSDALLFVDIEGKAIHRWKVSEGLDQVSTTQLDEMPGCVVPSLHPTALIVGTESGFHNTWRNSTSSMPDCFTEHHRLNDGKVDSLGRLWCGSMRKTEPFTQDGSLYCFSPVGPVRTKIKGGIGISNGLCWSSDSQYFYYIDTTTQSVARYDFDLIAVEISNPTTIITFPDEKSQKFMGYPDGMTIDEEGMLWIAHWGGSRVTRWNPDTGQLLFTVNLPVENVTSVTFGGPELDILYITTAKAGLASDKLDSQPLAGGVFAVRPGAVGLPGNVFGRKEAAEGEEISRHTGRRRVKHSRPGAEPKG